MKILFRHSLAELGEYEYLAQHFDVIDSRSLVKPGDSIICRYSALPFYNELEHDISALGGKMVTSYRQHLYVADLRNWYDDLSTLTPKTWFTLADAISSDYVGPFVLKGSTNSRKNLWRTHMYAQDKNEMREVYFRLLNDSMISEQGVYIREYEPLVSYGESLSGIPIAKEFRFFVYEGKVIARGFYWSSHLDLFPAGVPDVAEVPEEFVQAVIAGVADQIPFWVFDCAQRQDGVWRLIELNDGQMSGLSCIPPEELYGNLANILLPRQ
jgi:hypothetical protein